MVWSWLTFWVSLAHAADDAPAPAQAFFRAAWSEPSADWSVLTVTWAVATCWLPLADASDAACSSAARAC